MNCFQGNGKNILPDKGKFVILMIILICLALPLWSQSGNFTFSTLENALPSNASLNTPDPLQGIFRSPWTTERYNSIRFVRDECYDLIYNRSMGWFCKAEWKLEQKTGIPVRFRLGSYTAAARLEGK